MFVQVLLSCRVVAFFVRRVQAEASSSNSSSVSDDIIFFNLDSLEIDTVYFIVCILLCVLTLVSPWFSACLFAGCEEGSLSRIRLPCHVYICIYLIV